MGRRQAYTGFWWGNLREKSPLGRPKRRWVDNIKVNLQEVGWGVWTGLIWHGTGTGGKSLVHAVMNLRIPQNCGEFLD
jgi:hypothetical protein